MSILSSLNRAYDRLAERHEVPPFGYSSQNIHICIVLNSDGSLSGPPVLWNKDEKGKKTSRMMDVPYSGGRSGRRPPPYFLWDNTAYVLGVTAKNFDPSERHDDFKRFHLQSIKQHDNEELRSLYNFIISWAPQKFYEVGFVDESLDLNIVFRLQSRMNFIHECPAAQELWRQIRHPDTVGNGVCLVTGVTAPIARLHPPLVSFENPARIVSFNDDAYESYGHKKGANAPVSEEAAFKYTAVLNNFLRIGSSNRNRIQIGDCSTVFWADASDSPTADLAEDIFLAMADTVDETKQAGEVGALLEKIRLGQPLRDVAPKLSEGVRFYVLGLAPNAARVSVRFWMDSDFGKLADNFQRYFTDAHIEPPPRDPHPPLWKYLLETAVLGKRENVPPNLAGDCMRAILTGGRYPLTLLSNVLMRLRSDRDVSALRMSLLKALLIRNFDHKENLVAFDPDNTNKGYLLGRLFALYEHVQTAALGRNVNATVKDKFYGSASAQPRKVFHLLDSGSANHLSKIGKQMPGLRVTLERQIGAIMDLMSPDDDPFPASLSSEQQALFGLGYYHQRNEFFRAKTHETSVQEETAP